MNNHDAGDKKKGSGKFNETEQAAFKPGGKYSTEKKREQDSGSDFLLPKERKFPYKVNGRISCNLLRAAISRAGQNNYPEVKKRAEALYEEHC